MSQGRNKIWLQYLKDIDIKCFEWPWDWEKESDTNTVKVWLDSKIKVPRGFAVYRKCKAIVKLEKEVIHLLKLAVHPSWRCTGIGTKLLAQIVISAQQQNVNFIIANVHEENQYSIAWLTKRGFVSYGVHKNMYPDKRDGYAFLKRVQ